MPVSYGRKNGETSLRTGGLLLALAAALVMGGCSASGINDDLALLTSSKEPEPEVADPNAPPMTDLQKALDYWAKEYAKKPQDAKAALAYAKNLKAAGQKRQALQVLQSASMFHSTNKELASEYGRLALEFDQVALAKQLLEVADDPARPDWKVISARGTALAKHGQYKDAIPFYERALTFQPDHPSLMNNLALAYTMNGEADKAEELLRRATAMGGENAKVRQNLALVLGLQGKYDEATQVGSVALAPDAASANTALVRKMVKLEPKAMPKPAAAPAAAPAVPVTAVAKAQAPATALKPSTVETAASDSAPAWSTTVAGGASATPASAATPAGGLFKGTAQ